MVEFRAYLLFLIAAALATALMAGLEVLSMAVGRPLRREEDVRWAEFFSGAGVANALVAGVEYSVLSLWESGVETELNDVRVPEVLMFVGYPSIIARGSKDLLSGATGSIPLTTLLSLDLVASDCLVVED